MEGEGLLYMDYSPPPPPHPRQCSQPPTSWVGMAGPSPQPAWRESESECTSACVLMRTCSADGWKGLESGGGLKLEAGRPSSELRSVHTHTHNVHNIHTHNVHTRTHIHTNTKITCFCFLCLLATTRKTTALQGVISTTGMNKPPTSVPTQQLVRE